MAKGSHWSKHKYDIISPCYKDYNGEYRIWHKMKERCINPSNSMYPIYGGRGIKVCERWVDEEQGFINFYNDMGARPKEKNGKNYQIDRIDVNGDYCPENCRWVKSIENSQNKRNSKFIYLFNEKYCITEACRLFNIKRTTVTESVRLGRKNIEQAFIDALGKDNKICVL